MNGGLSAVGVEGFRIEPQASAGAIAVKLSGNCDSQATSLLDGFLTTLHEQTVTTSVKTVTLDCQDLYFMNSASLKSFVTWLTKIKILPTPQRYQVTIRTNRNLAWQSRSFGAIQRSAPEALTVLG
jgi:hypothetical protein